MRPLAIIEHDSHFALRVLRTVEAAGFRAAIFPHAHAALPLLRERHFALTLLDLEDAHALEICHDASPFVPLIVFGGDHDACSLALESGADDCICRGVPDRELVARIRNVLRRAEQPVSELASVVSEMRVRFDDRVHDLTAGETAVLTALIDHAPAPMTAMEIARAIGANRGTVESRIKSLRKKLGAERLVSRGRVGYQLGE